MSVKIDASRLRALIEACFEGLAIPQADAVAVADVLVYANLRGIGSHGVDRVPAYMRRVNAGAVVGSGAMSVVAEHGPLRRMDAARALGPAAATKATDAAIDLARRHGAGIVALGNCGHFGAAGYYALRVARAGMLAIVATNGPRVMAPYGAAEPYLGANPVAFGAPLGERDEMVLDMSSTAVAKGKIRRAHALGKAIESGWALDADGEPTTDPAAALAGSVLPAGGAKGSGLAFAICVFATLLAGADIDPDAASIYGDPGTSQNLGQLFIAIDPWRLNDRGAVRRSIDPLIEALHGLSPRPDFEEVRYPGEGAAARMRESLSTGIQLERGELEAWADACRGCELDDLAEAVGRLARA